MGHWPSDREGRPSVAELAKAILAVVAFCAAIAAVTCCQPQLALVTAPVLYPSPSWGVRFEKPYPLKPLGNGDRKHMHRQPHGTDVCEIETAHACWPSSHPREPKETTWSLPNSNDQSSNDNSPVSVALTGARVRRSAGSNQSLTGPDNFPTLTGVLHSTNVLAASPCITASAQEPNSSSPLAIQTTTDRVHSTRVLVLQHPQMQTAKQQSGSRHTRYDLLLPMCFEHIGSPGSCSLCCMQLQHSAGTAPRRAANNLQLIQRSVSISDRNVTGHPCVLGPAELNDLLPLATSGGPISTIYDMPKQADGNTTHVAEDLTCLFQQIFLLLDVCAVCLHLQATTMDDQLQRALYHRAGRMESVIAKVVANSLWHCFSCHQWADVYAVAYGCLAAHALSHASSTCWLDGLDRDVLQTLKANALPAALLSLTLLAFTALLSQAGLVRIHESRPGTAMAAAAAILLTTASSHGETIRFDTTNLGYLFQEFGSCIIICTAAYTACYVAHRYNEIDELQRKQLTGVSIVTTFATATLAATALGLHQCAYVYVYASCIIMCTATSAACYITRRYNETDKQSREQFIGTTIAAALAAAALATATLGLYQHESATGQQLTALSVAVPRSTNVYTILCSLVVVSLPSVTLEPAGMDHQQLNSSWEETCTIMASGRRVLAPGEATLKNIKKLARAKHTPTDLRNACNEMKKAAAESHKAIMAHRQTQEDHWKAETKKAKAEAEKLRQTSPSTEA